MFSWAILSGSFNEVESLYKLAFSASTWEASKEGLRTNSDMKATASLIWLLSNMRENWVSSRVTVTSTLPPKESIRRSISSLENLEVPLRASREMNWETELLSRSSCRVPALTVTVILNCDKRKVLRGAVAWPVLGGDPDSVGELLEAVGSSVLEGVGDFAEGQLSEIN